MITSLSSENEELAIVVSNRNLYRETDPVLDRDRFIWDSDYRYPHNRKLFNDMVRRYPQRNLTTLSYGDELTHTRLTEMVFASKISNELTKLNHKFNIEISSQIHEIDRNMVFLSNMIALDMHYISGFFSSEKFIFTTVRKKNKSYYLRHFISENDTININPVRGNKRYGIIKKKTIYNGKKILFLLANRTIGHKYLYAKLFEPSFTKEILDKFDGEEPVDYEVLIEINVGPDKGESSHKIISVSGVD